MFVNPDNEIIVMAVPQSSDDGRYIELSIVRTEDGGIRLGTVEASLALRKAVLWFFQFSPFRSYL